MEIECKICRTKIPATEEFCPNCTYVMSAHMIDPVTVLVALVLLAIIGVTLGRYFYPLIQTN